MGNWEALVRPVRLTVFSPSVDWTQRLPAAQLPELATVIGAPVAGVTVTPRESAFSECRTWRTAELMTAPAGMLVWLKPVSVIAAVCFFGMLEAEATWPSLAMNAPAGLAKLVVPATLLDPVGTRVFGP